MKAFYADEGRVGEWSCDYIRSQRVNFPTGQFEWRKITFGQQKVNYLTVIGRMSVRTIIVVIRASCVVCKGRAEIALFLLITFLWRVHC